MQGYVCCTALQFEQWYRLLAKNLEVVHLSGESGSSLEDSVARRHSPFYEVDFILLYYTRAVRTYSSIQGAQTLQQRNVCLRVPSHSADEI